MSNFSAHKQSFGKTSVFKPQQLELNNPPRQFNDYMAGEDNRFCEVCRLYLDGMSMDDLKYLKPDDIINLVPPEHYKHKLLMTIMVRRYLCRSDCDDSNSSCCNPGKVEKTDTYQYSCDNCDHVCTNPNCSHSCADYAKL